MHWKFADNISCRRLWVHNICILMDGLCNCIITLHVLSLRKAYKDFFQTIVISTFTCVHDALQSSWNISLLTETNNGLLTDTSIFFILLKVKMKSLSQMVGASFCLFSCTVLYPIYLFCKMKLETPLVIALLMTFEIT